MIKFRVSVPRSHGLGAWGLIVFFWIWSLGFGISEDTAFLSAPIGFAKLRAKVEELGFPALASPLEIRKGEMPALTEKGEPEISDLKLTYEKDATKSLPAELTFDLTAEECASAAKLLKAENGKWKMENGKLKIAGLSALKLADFQFVRPLGGETGDVKEWRLAFTALTAEKLSLLQSSDSQETAEVVSVSNVLLGGEYRQMEVDTKKKKVELSEKKERSARVGMKPKDPKNKRVGLGLPKPESGEDPTVFMATVGPSQFSYEIIAAEETTGPSRRSPIGWLFRAKDGATFPELILPSQFDGKEALGVFVRVLEHSKDPFRPRTRKATLEVVLVEVKFEE
jgi:hypothetical protein